jgi:hypothetical protein
MITRPFTLHFTKSPNDRGKIADCEIQFHDGILAGLKLCGFGIWQSRYGKQRLNVTMPSKMIKVNGPLQSFALLRPISDSRYESNLRDFILDAYVKTHQ